ncbi:hypothetical protein [Cryobacterium sp. CG_9.6]|uniref:hypothetical protein n=1 Tax=Cryobacterium sp. CG_9.6 TaxID=2760710 RepID=UPI0024770832|nr:hypothetical protein [Cryobacterium sp. CG_9.6]MDH6238050.1 hypothetical protein [Cryobacterium sp. CG_9.6]
MLLIHRPRVIRVHGRVGESEHGSALAAVLGVMAVGLIFVSLITTSIVGSFGVSTSVRAGVQSGAAADAGIAAARRGLYTIGNCAAQPTPGKYVSTVAPVYSATVDYFRNGAWTTGCPPETANQVRIVSRGTAQSSGVNGALVGDSTSVEAVFTYVVPGIMPSGTALYLYKGGIVESNSGFDMTEAPAAGLMIKNGNFDCAKNNSVINGSMSVAGNLTFTGSCTVNGSAWVGGTATLGIGSIRDNLTARAVSPNPPGSRVGGMYNPPVPPAPAPPTVPPWTDQGYNPAAWIDPAGTPYEVRTLNTPAACVLPNGSLGGTSAGAPVILDGRGCTLGVAAGSNTTVKLTSDVVIFANRFDFSGTNSLTFASSTSTPRRLWFITPDLQADAQPTCNSGVTGTQGDFSVGNGFAISDPVTALLYTPCAFNGVNGFTWRGQIISGQYSSLKNNPSFTFASLGLPGVNLTTGGPSSTITTPQPGAVISRREVTG